MTASSPPEAKPKSNAPSRSAQVLGWLAVVGFCMAAAGLFLVQFEQARSLGKQERLRSAAQQAADESGRVFSGLATVFDTLAAKPEAIVSLPSLSGELKRSSSPTWDQMVAGEYAFLAGGERAQRTELLKSWNLARPLTPVDGILSFQDPSTQRVYFATMRPSGLFVVCLMPSDVMKLILPDRSQMYELGLLAHPDGRIVSHQELDGKHPQLLLSTDSLGLNVPFVQQALYGDGASGLPGARLMSTGETESLAASSGVWRSNVSVVTVSQVSMIPILQGAFNLAAMVLVGVLLVSGLLFAWSRRRIAQDLLRATEAAAAARVEALGGRLAATESALMRISDWQIATTEGAGVVFSAPGELSDFGFPGSARALGQSEINPNWKGRMFLARLGKTDCFAVAILDVASPLQESLRVYFETLFGSVPQTDESQIPAWVEERQKSFETLFANFSPSDRESVRDIGIFFWSPAVGIFAQFGSLSVEVIENEYWHYVQLVGGAGSPSVEFDVRSPLILWRTLRTEVPIEQAPHVEDNQGNTTTGERSLSEGDVALPSEDPPKEGPVSACHWMVVVGVVLALLALMSWRGPDGRGQSLWQGEAFAAASGADPSESPKPMAKDAIGFGVESLVGIAHFRAPGSTEFERVTPKVSIPIGSEVILTKSLSIVEMVREWTAKKGQSLEPSLKLRHRVHGSLVLAGEGSALLSEEHFSRNLGGLRFTESEEIPSRVEVKTSSSQTPLERVFAFFLPRNDIPSDFPKSARAEIQQRFPIVIRYPERVFLIKTNTLPAVVSLSWQPASEHAKPYRIYLWSEDRASNAPVLETKDTNATVQISQHGRYYWQIEDRLGNFVSAPRTLMVNALDTEVAGPGESDPLRPDRKTVFRDIQNIPVEFPVADGLIYGCPEKGDTRLPVRFHHSGSDVVRYEVTVSPSRSPAAVVSAPAADGIVISDLELPPQGTYALKIMGYDGNNKVTATSESVRGVFYPTCGIARQPEFLAQVFKVTKGKTLPELGLLHVMGGAY